MSPHQSLPWPVAIFFKSLPREDGESISNLLTKEDWESLEWDVPNNKKNFRRKLVKSWDDGISLLQTINADTEFCCYIPREEGGMAFALPFANTKFGTVLKGADYDIKPFRRLGELIRLDMPCNSWTYELKEESSSTRAHRLGDITVVTFHGVQTSIEESGTEATEKVEETIDLDDGTALPRPETMKELDDATTTYNAGFAAENNLQKDGVATSLPLVYRRTLSAIPSDSALDVASRPSRSNSSATNVVLIDAGAADRRQPILDRYYGKIDRKFSQEEAVSQAAGGANRHWTLHDIKDVMRGDRYMMYVDPDVYPSPRYFYVDGYCKFYDGTRGLVCLGEETNHSGGIQALDKDRRLGCIHVAAKDSPGHTDGRQTFLVEGWSPHSEAFVNINGAMIFPLNSEGRFFARWAGRMVNPELIDEVAEHIRCGFRSYRRALMEWHIQRMKPRSLSQRLNPYNLRVPETCDLCGSGCWILQMVHDSTPRSARNTSARAAFPYDGNGLSIPWLRKASP